MRELRKSLNLETLRQANVLRCEKSFHPLDDWSEMEWACAAAGELGEMCNLIKKRRRGEDVPVSEVMKEMADVIIYLDLLAARMRVHLSGPIRDKFNEVSKRISSDVFL